MKLVVDLRMINVSGIGVYLKNIIPEVAKEIDLVVLGNKEELKKFDWAKNLKIIDFRAKFYSLKEQFLYPFKIPRADIYWCPHFNVPLLPIRAKKVLTTIYDVNHLANKNSISFLKWVYAKLLYDSAVSKSIEIITISEFSKSELCLKTNVKKSKINVIYCGVNFKLFFNSTSLQTTKFKKYILFVGNVKPHKNLITLLKAYNVLSSQIKSEYKLLILGKKEGFMTPDLEIFKFINDNNLEQYINFTGYVEDDDVPSFYQKASLFVFPSLYEGFGLPILEAMASGIPVLSSNSSSLPEVGGDAVVYFNPKDNEQLSQLIEKFLFDTKLREECIIKGLQQVKHFSWKPAAEKHIEIIKKMIN